MVVWRSLTTQTIRAGPSGGGIPLLPSSVVETVASRKGGTPTITSPVVHETPHKSTGTHDSFVPSEEREVKMVQKRSSFAL